jgi:hypothetical protein
VSMDDFEVYGRVNHRGDKREQKFPPVPSVRHGGIMYPLSVEYDEEADLTRVEYGVRK